MRRDDREIERTKREKERRNARMPGSQVGRGRAQFVGNAFGSAGEKERQSRVTRSQVSTSTNNVEAAAADLTAAVCRTVCESIGVDRDSAAAKRLLELLDRHVRAAILSSIVDVTHEMLIADFGRTRETTSVAAGLRKLSEILGDIAHVKATAGAPHGHHRGTMPLERKMVFAAEAETRIEKRKDELHKGKRHRGTGRKHAVTDVLEEMRGELATRGIHVTLNTLRAWRRDGRKASKSIDKSPN